mmetsp:Transcript_3350/g.4458  ORF Transcript_3350/g.4458 Transcript_3350/m.4458 type:complete len:168 (+) Transcript_3350:121-624(+)
MKFTEVASIVVLALLGAAVRGSEAGCGLVMGYDDVVEECGNDAQAYLQIYAVIAYEIECKSDPDDGDTRALIGENVCDKNQMYCEDNGIQYCCYVYERDCSRRLEDQADVTIVNKGVSRLDVDALQECDIEWAEFLENIKVNFLDNDAGVSEDVKTCFSQMWCRKPI